MAIQTDFLAAVNQIAAERGIDPDEIVEAIKSAIKTGYKHDYETGESLIVEFNEDGRGLSVFADKKVVKSVTDDQTQILLADAKKIESKLEVGDHVQVDVTPEGDFGRIAAQAAKQVILQKIREAERETIMADVKDKIGEVETGVIQRMDGDSVIIEIRKANAVMPFEDRIPGEYYQSGSPIKVLLKEIEIRAKGKTLIVSRSATEFLAELFAIEIPEIMSGSVEIMGIAREAGARSKIAVRSNQEGVDPIGSCVGQRGVRINTIMDELKGEKIDIIVWNEDIKEYIGNALSPAQVLKIDINEDDRVASIIVPDDQLSLAIGKDGQNVRLAAKLTGWKIDIKGETLESDEEQSGDVEEKDAKKKTKEKSKQSKSESDLDNLGLPSRVLTALDKAGIKTKDDLKSKLDAKEKIAGIGPKATEEILAKI